MLEIGSLLDGKYRILSVIGHGGMSTVYMARNEKANRTWAVKEVRRDGIMDYEAVRQGLVVETNLLKKLRHKNIVSIIDVIEDKDTFIIVMDLIDGKDLYEIVKETGAQPQDKVIEWAMQLCDVLGYLHSQNPPIIYRDMKPKNIMLTPGGNGREENITLIDFGIAREHKSKNVADTTCLGTIGYAAPEQFGGHGQTDARTDIYCLGATLYHLVTGKNPSEPPYEMKPIREINPSLSKGLEQIIEKCTRRNPDERYQSAAELLVALQHYRDVDLGAREKEKKQLAGFIATCVLTVVFAGAGLGFRLSAASKAVNTYETRVAEAARTSDYDTKIGIYQDCIEISNQAGQPDAYLGLIQAYKENDSRFTVEEAQQIEKLISNHREELKETGNYTDICFETGKLFWYYYDYGNENQITRAKSSVEWFDEVLANAEEGYPNIGMAKVYSNVGSFYRDITLQVTEASDTGKYRPFFEDLSELMRTVAKDDSEAEIVRLELLEMMRSAIQQYATKFKGDGIKENEMLSMVAEIETDLERINTTADLTAERKRNSLRLIDDTRKAVTTAFGTREEAKGDN